MAGVTSNKEIFLSYSRDDAIKPFVASLKHDLEQNGFSVWLDIEDIPDGSDSRACTGISLHSCKGLIAVISNSYVTSRYSTSELYAADADQKHIFPVFIEDVDFQQSQKSMGVKYVIGGLEWLYFRPGFDNYDTSLTKLTKGMKAQGLGAVQDITNKLAGLKVGGVVPSAPPVSVLHNLPPPQYHDIYPNTQESIDDDDDEEGDESDGNDSNDFHVGMKLEALDRRFPYFVCVATVADKRANEIKIHFDGWGPEYDYWCDIDLVELHPVGWCGRHGYELQPPLNLPFTGWNRYLSETQTEPCDTPMFNEIQINPPGSLNFRIGMKLEAKDRKYPDLLCVATVKDINKEEELLIHFDGWSDDYDYWCKPDSTDIHPAMWGGKHHKQVQPPKGYGGHFRWNVYLADPDINPAPAHIFTAVS